MGGRAEGGDEEIVVVEMSWHFDKLSARNCRATVGTSTRSVTRNRKS